MALENIVAGLRESPYVKEKDLGNGISSFNFTRKAFWRNHWNGMTTKARGLFIDTENMRVKARSYNKFFNLNEQRESELQNILKTWEYPVAAYVKENGYLGICSWNEDGTLFCASKSTTEGIYAERFKKILLDTLGDKVEQFSLRLKSENLSAVFEVIDPEYDTHIIEYKEPKVILLDLIYNEWEPGDLDFLNKSYEVLQTWGIVFGLPIKQKAFEFWNAAELESFINNAISFGYKYNQNYIEGFVLEDIDMRHVKIKTEYYNFWKSIRKAIPIIRKGLVPDSSKINWYLHPETLSIIETIQKYAVDYYNSYDVDISVIEIRKLWEDDFCN